MVGMEDVNEPATGSSTERDASGTEANRCAYVPSSAHATPRLSGLVTAKYPPAVIPTSLLCALADTASKRAKQPNMDVRTIAPYTCLRVQHCHTPIWTNAEPCSPGETGLLVASSTYPNSKDLTFI